MRRAASPARSPGLGAGRGDLDGVMDSCGSLSGGLVVDRPGQERLAEDDARCARVAHAADACEVGDAARDDQVGVDVRASAAIWAISASPVAWPRTNRRTPRPASSLTRSASVGGEARCQAKAASRSGPRVEPDREPVARDLEARPQELPDRPRRRGVATTRVAPAAKATRMASGESRPPASWSGVATRDAIAPNTSVFTGAPRRAPSKSTTWIIGAPRPTKCSAIRSGRSVGAPMPVETPGQKTIRDRPASTSIAGMTCTRPARPGGRRGPRREAPAGGS